MSYTEIGQILGVSEHAATLLVARARETLAPLLRVFRAP
jgi:DNA-directed RNA polymerase specialized sigma24 family protein